MLLKNINSNLTIGIVIFYGVMAIGLRYTPKEPELFPFFSWRLFAGVPNTKIEYGVEIIKFNGQVLDKPVIFSEANFLESSKSVSARKLIQEFANSYSTNKDYQKYKSLLESVYLGKTEEYRLVKQTYNPVEKFYKANVKKESIATFYINVN
jgi:hypothetical protein